jgi:hypothetical protein
MPNTRRPEPTITDGDDGRCLIIDMPPMTDEAAYQLSELLRTLWETFDAHYADQLAREYRRRDGEREKLFRERCFAEAQRWLPFDGELDDELAF